jgi:hypothetical protein
MMIAKFSTISEDGVYRYRLTRTWLPSKEQLVICMLNPSTADAKQDDPTIRKCLWFAGSWSYGGIDVVNLCAYRATKPAELFEKMRQRFDVVGPENLMQLKQAFIGRDVLCAWGDGALRLNKNHVEFVKQLLHERAKRLYCLNVTARGNPSHPLYIAKHTKPTEYDIGGIVD